LTLTLSTKARSDTGSAARAISTESPSLRMTVWLWRSPRMPLLSPFSPSTGTSASAVS